jgi:DNA-binding FrmR family transcriptional regulator
VQTTANELKLVRREDKKELQDRLARIEGQIRGIREMIEREESCELVAQQLAAVREALNKAFAHMVASTIQHNCSGGQMEDPAAQAKLLSLVRILMRYS